jgi:hypothetical protein
MAVTYILPTISTDYTYDLSSYLNYHGLFGRDLINIYNEYGIFQNGYYLAILYNVIKLDNYIIDVETTFNTMGQDGWKFVTLYNGNAIFKKFSSLQSTTPGSI